MALTNSQKVQIRLYLGWSARFRQFDSRLEGAFHALDALETDGDPDTLAMVVDILADLADLEPMIVDAYSRLQATKLGSIDLDAVKEIGMLRSEGRRLVGRLSATMGIPVRHDVFSGRAPSAFASPRGMVPETNGGNLPRLG